MIADIVSKYIKFTSVLVLILLAAGRSVRSETIRSRRGEEPIQNHGASNGNGNGQSQTRSGNSSCLDASDHPDRMITFPGWNQPLPSAWYSGCR
jgi:hypothetical protein